MSTATLTAAERRERVAYEVDNEGAICPCGVAEWQYGANVAFVPFDEATGPDLDTLEATSERMMCRGCGRIVERASGVVVGRVDLLAWHRSRSRPTVAAMRREGIEARTNRVTGTTVVVERADDDEYAWQTVCGEHYELVAHETKYVARQHAAMPEWCSFCQRLMVALDDERGEAETLRVTP
jgi:hypothetical protein